MGCVRIWGGDPVQIFYRRPLCLLCVLFLLAMMAGSILSFRVSVLAGVVLLAAALWFAISVRRKQIGFLRGCMIVAGLLAVVLGLCSSSLFYQYKIPATESLAGKECLVEGRILSREWGRGYHTGYTVHLTLINEAEISADALFTCEYPADWRPGELVRMKVDIETLDEKVNGFAERRYYHTKGIFLRLISAEPGDVTSLGNGGFSLKLAAARLNELLSARIEQAVGHREGELMSALFLARRDDLPDSVVRNFGRLGLSHLLALSGLHLSLVVGLLKKMLSFLFSKSMLTSGFVLLIVGAYCILTGAPISVLRAAAMLAVIELFSLLWDEGDLQTALFLAVSLICLFSPSALFDIGLWMSATSTLGLILLSQMSLFSRCPAWLRIPMNTVTVSLVATLATLPMVWLVGGEISLLFMPANFLFLPLATGILYGALPAALLGRWGIILCLPFRWMARLTLELVDVLSHRRGITISLQYDFLPWIIVLFAVITSVFLIGKWKRKRLFLLSLCLLLVGFGIGIHIERQDTGIDLICTAEGTNETLAWQGKYGAVVVDFTDGSYSSLNRAANQMHAEGQTEIEILMLTHYHTKHIGALLRLSDKVTLRQIWSPYPNSDREWEILLDLQENAMEQGIEVALYRDGEKLCLGETEIIAYTREKIPRSAQPLTLLQIRHGEECLTYCGASVFEGATGQIARSMISESETVIFGGHGPKFTRQYDFNNSTVTETIVFTTKDVLSFADLTDESMASALLGAQVFVGKRDENVFTLRME